MKRFLISGLICLSAFCSFAQSARLISTREGLCSSNINSLMTDSSGNLWIGTTNGLNRFDGFSITSYYNNPSDRNSIINDVINIIHEDVDENILIGTLSGLCMYSPDSQQFSNISFLNKERPNISSIITKHDGTVLVGTRGYGGLYELQKNEDGRIIAVPMEFNNGLDMSAVIAIFEDVNHNIWLWVNSKGIFTVLQDGRIEKVLDTPEDNEQYVYGGFCEDSFDSMYIAGWNTGLLRRKEGEKEFKQIMPEKFNGMHITGLHHYSGHIYISTYRNGIFDYDIENEELSTLSLEYGEETIRFPQVNDMIFDDSGNMVVGIAHKGVLIKSNNRKSFLNMTGGGRTDEFNSKSPVQALSINQEGNLWIGTEGDGIFMTDKNFKVLRHYPTEDEVLAVFEDRNGDVWYGQTGKGLFRVKRGEKKPEPFELKDSHGKDMLNVSEILEDNRGRLWVFSTGYGAAFINKERTEYVNLTNGDDLPYSERQSGDLLENKWVNCAKNVKGKIYIGTYNGLSCYNIRTNSFLSIFPDRNRILTARVINDIEEDRNGDLWLATTTGLFQLDHESFKYKRYNFSNGLPQNNISSVVEDKQGRIWVSTSNGLSFLDRDTDQFTSIMAPMRSNNEFCINSTALFDNDGTIMFGSQEGITWFNPDDIVNSSSVSSFKVSDISANGGHILSSALKGNNVALKYKENTFSLEFSTGSFRKNSHASFSYRLDNGNIEFLPLWTNKVTFNKLKPGKYHLTVFCKSPEESYEDLNLDISVHHAWYASTIANILYFLALAGVLVFIYFRQKNKYYRKEKLQQDMHELEMNEAKLRYFFNLAHEIRMPMSLIISPLSKLIATDKDASRQVQYGIMANNARRISLLINQIMDIRKIEKGKMSLHFSETDINQYLRPLVEIMEQNARLKSISLSFIPAEDDPEVWIDVNQFDKIVLNLLQNAIKYTPEGGEVSLTARTDKDSLKLSVYDNGIGIDEDKLDRIFERFYQVNSNDSAIGVGIGLNLVQSLVSMHHGKVSAHNNINSPGTVFDVEIPLGRKHLSDEETANMGITSEHIATSLDLYETQGGETIASDSAKVSKQRNSVAIVEDNAEIRNYLEKELSPDFNVTTYENGTEAYEGILKDIPDIIVSDVVMPGMDGFLLCDKIKKNINTNAVPIILLTGKTEEIDKLTGMDVGADAYITKPFNIILLKKNIEQLIGNLNRLRNIYNGRQSTRIENLPDIKNADDSLMARISKVLNNNIGNPELNVDFLAHEAGLSRVHLYRKLMELTNQSPGEFIRNARLKMAAEMLVDKQLDISTTAAECGFSSVSVFSRAFKQLYGMSPSEYVNKKSGV